MNDAKLIEVGQAFLAEHPVDTVLTGMQLLRWVEAHGGGSCLESDLLIDRVSFQLSAIRRHLNAAGASRDLLEANRFCVGFTDRSRTDFVVRIDVLALRTWIQQHRPDHAVIERGQALPRQGASSGFKFGRGCGALEAVIQLLEIPMTIIEPTAWKKFHGLRGKEKEASRQRALMLFPAAHALFARRKDHGRSEAALLALYGAALYGANLITPTMSAATITTPSEVPYETA